MDKKEHPSPAKKPEKRSAEIRALKREKVDPQKSLKMEKGLMDSLPSGVVLIQQGKIVHTNESILDQMGYSLEEVMGRPFLDFVHHRSTELARAIHESGVIGKWIPDPFEIEIVTKDGNRLCFEVEVKKIKFSGKKAF